jgi:hypothetical protein
MLRPVAVLLGLAAVMLELLLLSAFAAAGRVTLLAAACAEATAVRSELASLLPEHCHKQFA